MKVLVTGASGFVGSALCDALRAAGREATALSRDPEATRSRVPSIRAAFPWSPREEEPPEAAFDGVDAVVHLAGESVVGRWTPAKREAIRESRVAGTRNLVRGMERARARPAVLISAGAVGYYGDRGEESLTEESSPGSDFLAETAVAWEKAAALAAGFGTRVVCLRIGIVLERDGGALGKMLPPAKLGLGWPLGSGRQWWSWIHRDDLVKLTLFALDNADVAGPLNATAPGATRQKEFAATLGAALGRPAFLPAPAFALKLLLGGFSTELLSSKRVIPAQAEKFGFRFEHPELRGALDDALKA